MGVQLIGELTCNRRFTMVNYMHVRSNGDPVEITGESDILAISCDLITHAVDMLMSMCKLGNCNSVVRILIARICVEEASYLDTGIGTCICWFVYESVRWLYFTESSWIRVLYEIVSWFMIYIIYDSGVFSFTLSW